MLAATIVGAVPTMPRSKRCSIASATASAFVWQRSSLLARRRGALLDATPQAQPAGAAAGCGREQTHHARRALAHVRARRRTGVRPRGRGEVFPLKGRLRAGGRGVAAPGLGVEADARAGTGRARSPGTGRAWQTCRERARAALEWPGKPGAGPPAPPLTAGEQQRFNARKRDVSESLRGLPPAGWTRTRESSRQPALGRSSRSGRPQFPFASLSTGRRDRWG